jgi:L-alanine-DL-glutamate epimerase-like enolase superfamily enzyme
MTASIDVAIPRVRAIRMTGVAVPYRAEVGTVVTAGLELSEARHLLVEVLLEDGSIGLGEGVPRPSVYGETLDGMRAVIERLLGPPLIGMRATDTERAWASWDRVVGNQAAKGALDLALHDAAARLAGMPLWRLLGGWADDSIPLTMALGMGSPRDLAQDAARAVADGYAGVKLKVGKDIATDATVVAAVREAVGPAVLLYVDANCGYSRAEAIRVLPAFEQAALGLLEEPLAMADTKGRAYLAQATRIPLLLDESTNDLARVPAELATGAAAAISIRASRSGITLSRHLVALAAAGGIGCLVGSHRELGIGVAANAHIAGAFRAMTYPAELGSHVHLTDSLLAEPLAIDGGRLRMPRGAGLGVDLDPDRVARHALWSSGIGTWVT